jgi:outer membrane protein assembly factor BamB
MKNHVARRRFEDKGFRWAVLSVLISACIPVLADDWPQYNGLNHNRRSAERLGLKESLRASPVEIWKIKTNTGFSSFTIGEGKAFTLVRRTVNDVDLEMCVALDIKTGDEIWARPLARAKYDRGGESGAAGNRGGDGPRSTPSHNNGKVYVLDAQLGLHCFDATSGEVIWAKDILKEHQGRLIKWQNAASPLIDGDLVFVMGGGPGQSLLAFDKDSGEVKWKAEDDQMTHATPIAATIRGQRQVIFFTQSGLVSVMPKTGKILWRQLYPHGTSAAASPVVFEDIVYCSAGYGVGAGAYRIKKSAEGFKSEQIWRQPNKLINHWSTPVCRDGYLYGMFSFKNYGKGPMSCVDIRTGRTEWSRDGFGPGNCIIVDGCVVALSDKGEVVIVEAGPKEYRELYRADILDGKCWSSPALSNGRLYVRSTTEGACLSFGG